MDKISVRQAAEQHIGVFSHASSPYSPECELHLSSRGDLSDPLLLHKQPTGHGVGNECAGGSELRVGLVETLKPCSFDRSGVSVVPRGMATSGILPPSVVRLAVASNQTGGHSGVGVVWSFASSAEGLAYWIYAPSSPTTPVFPLPGISHSNTQNRVRWVRFSDRSFSQSTRRKSVAATRSVRWRSRRMAGVDPMSGADRRTLAVVGRSSSDVLAAILDREPDPLAWYDPGVPADLQRIVTKALRNSRCAAVIKSQRHHRREE